VSRLLLALLSLAGLGVVGGIAHRSGISVGELLRALPAGAHLTALAAVLLDLLCRGARLSLLAKGLGRRLPLTTAAAAQLVGEAAASITPSRSGSDPARLLYLRGGGVDLPGAGAILVGERVAEGVALMTVAVVLSRFLPMGAPVILGTVGFAGGALLQVAGVWILARWRGTPEPPPWWALLRLSRNRWRRVRAGGRRFRRELTELGRIPLPLLSGVLATSLVRVGARLAVLPLLVLAVAPALPVAPLVAWPLLFLYAGSLLPPPGGGGGVEVGFALALAPVLPPDLMGPILLWWRFHTFYLGAVAGALVAGWGTLARVRAGGAHGAAAPG